MPKVGEYVMIDGKSYMVGELIGVSHNDVTNIDELVFEDTKGYLHRAEMWSNGFREA